MSIFRVINKIGRVSPYFISRIFSYIPFGFRLGSTYPEFGDTIKNAENWNDSELENYIVVHFDKIFQHSKTFNFYREKYKNSGVLDLVVHNLEDIQKIPVLSKKEIRENIHEFSGHFVENTGGTSGVPLPLYLDEFAWEREWAHFHDMWSRAGYRYTDTKFVVKKENSTDEFIKYNFQHNDFVVNAFKLNDDAVDAFFKTLTSKNIKFIHGYPSAIRDLLKNLEDKISIDIKEILQKQIKCCFFSSEYPTPQIIDYVRNVWGLNFISWYGHSEVCVLAAAEMNSLDYKPYHTYGYAEEEDNALIGTSYHNFDMPLVRYNTEDLIRVKKSSNGILESFEVKEGRIMDFIIDRNGLKISLTAMFRFREHEIFKHIDYIQVFQEKQGFATIIVSQNEGVFIDAPALMNLEDMNIKFDFLYLKKPIKTSSGKVPLRVRKLPN